jgi:hypothetical protein
MKKFVVKIINVSFYLLITTVLTICFVFKVPAFQTDFSISTNIKYLFFGASQIECSINDKLIKHSRNFAHSDEPYFYTLQKIKQILKKNNHVECIFIDYNNSVLQPILGSEKIWGIKNINHFLPIYSPFMELKDFIFLFKSNPINTFNAMIKSYKFNFKRIIKMDFLLNKIHGQFFSLDQNNLNKKYDEHIIKESQMNISHLNISILADIIKLCRDRNVNVYLIRVPIHEDYPVFNEKQLYQIKNSIFKNVEFFDLIKYPIQDKEFGDLVHLNNQGSTKFSLWINSLLENGLLNENNKIEFIKKSINDI